MEIEFETWGFTVKKEIIDRDEEKTGREFVVTVQHKGERKITFQARSSIEAHALYLALRNCIDIY